MSSDFLLIYGKTWQSIYNPLKRIEMNLQEAAVWMPRTGSPPGGQGENLNQGQSGWGSTLSSAKRTRPLLAGDRGGPRR